MGRFALATATRSDAGRRADNEDACHVGSAGPATFAVLCDGAGGHARGAEAARRSVAAIDASLRAATGFAPAPLRAALQSAHAGLVRRQRQARAAERMHATAVVLWIDGTHDRVLWAHVGDSRLYRLRWGGIERLTADDSVVQRMVETGVLSAAQAASHPMKHRLLAALGMQGAVEPRLPAAAEPLHDGDAFLLCSDGWWEALGDAEIAAAWQRTASARGWLAAMREAIDARAAPDQDNFSAIAVCVSDPQEDTRPPEDDP